jgi:PAS domain S-box-containing protein
MLSEVPKSDVPHASGADLPFVTAALEALLELTGATAGWVAVVGRDGRLTFPARRGAVPDGWLRLQQGWVPVWGFQAANGPARVNNLPALPALGEPPLHNVLTSPLPGGLGHVALANKPDGFTDADAAAVQATSQVLGRQLAAGPAPGVPPGLGERLLDRVAEGVLVVGEDGRLLFANAAWVRWTGYSAAELRDRRPPFPFWVCASDLAGTALTSLSLPAGPQHPSSPSYLPFRRRDGGVFWCQVELATEAGDGRPVTVALLRRLPGPAAAPGGAEEAGGAIAFRALAEALPFPAALTDRLGQLVWFNAAFRDELLPGATAGQTLRQAFTSASAAAVDRLLQDRPRAAEARRGRLTLEQADAAGRTRSWTAACLAAGGAEGTGFLFALAEDWAELWPADAALAPWQRPGTRPAGDWLPLLFRPGRPLAFWDARWSRLTGLSPEDQAGVVGEGVLDWLFPRQRDRDWVTDLVQHPARRGGQAVLEVVSPTGSRPLLCTLLPLAPEDGWLLLAGEPEEPADATARLLQRFLQPFGRELGRLLAQDAARRPGPPHAGGGDRLSWLGRLLDNCLRACHLLVALQDLIAEPPAGESQPVRLAELVRALLDESAGPAAGDYELTVEVRDAEATVRGQPALLKLILGHLLRQAAEAVRGREDRRVRVVVYARDGEVVCEISDTGAGWPAADWDALLAASALLPASLELPLEASGLALTVSQHLLTLQGGRLELRSRPGEGTTAVLTLPRERLAEPRVSASGEPEPLVDARGSDRTPADR